MMLPFVPLIRKYKQLSNYQKLYNSRFEWDIKQATLGKSYEEINDNKLTKSFLSVVLGMYINDKLKENCKEAGLIE